MSYKCRICGFNDVEEENGICDFCAMGRDPYAEAIHNSNGAVDDTPIGKNSTHERSSTTYVPAHGKRKRILLNAGKPNDHKSTVVSDNDMIMDSSVKVYQAGEMPSASFSSETSNSNTKENTTSPKNASGLLASGIVKNVSVDKQKKYFIQKLFDTLFTGVPFTLDNDIIMFQVFPDYTGTSLNAMGYACDQVIVYGKINAGVVSENNDIDVYGNRDSNNNIVAKKMRNKATGTIIEPARVLSPSAIWGITITVFLVLSVIVSSLGSEGIIWGVIFVFCLMNIPLVLKIIMAILGGIFSFFKRIF